jgi:3-deoxy-D-manno-octulosonic-acid transferase
MSSSPSGAINPKKRRSVGIRLASVLLDPRILAYYLGVTILSPVILIEKFRRWRRTRHEKEFAPIRWWVPNPTPSLWKEHRPEAETSLVFVCVSLGEAVIARPLAEGVEAARPDVRVSLCIRDPNSLRSIRDARWPWPLSALPFDQLFPVCRWLTLTRPDLVVFVEATQGKGLIPSLVRFGSKVILINGRSRNPFRTLYRVFRPFYRWCFSGMDGYYVTHEKHARHRGALADAGAELRVLGNVKYDLPVSKIDPERAASLDRWFSQARGAVYFVAGSTEIPEEEEIVLDAFAELRSRLNCRLLIAPRNPKRGREVAARAAAKSLSASLRTESGPDADVYVLDTLGELAYSFSIGVSAYIGGFFGKKGGHNVLEPLVCGVPFVCGRKMTVFEELIAECEEAGIGVRFESSEELAALWERRAAEPLDKERVRAKAEEILKPHVGLVTQNVAAILSHLPRSGVPPASGTIAMNERDALAGAGSTSAKE